MRSEKEHLWLCSPFHNYIKGGSCTSLHSFLLLDILSSHLHLLFSSDILTFGSLRSFKSLFLFIFFIVLKSLFRVVIQLPNLVSLFQIIRASSHHVFPRSGILCWQRSIPSKGAATLWSWSIHASLDAEPGLRCWISVRAGNPPAAIPRAASGPTSAASPQPTT